MGSGTQYFRTLRRYGVLLSYGNYEEIIHLRTSSRASLLREPPPAVKERYGYTWNLSAFGGSTPIHSSFPPFLWADHPIVRGAWTDMKIKVQEECAGGNKDGLCWVPISEDPMTARRSHSGLAHYDAVKSRRTNYDLLVQAPSC